jgi:hypothetical protein
VRWCAGALVRWCAGALVRWCAGALVRPFSKFVQNSFFVNWLNEKIVLKSLVG